MVSNVHTACLVMALGWLIPVLASAQEGRFQALANSPFAHDRPTAETARLLTDELHFQRASQVYLWALPVLNLYGMKEGSEAKFGAGYHVLPVFKKRLDAKTLITTPNSDVIYALSYLDVGQDGPLAFEAPPGLQGPNLAKLKNLARLTLSGGLSGAGAYTQSSLLLVDCVVHSHAIAFSLRLTPARRS